MSQLKRSTPIGLLTVVFLTAAHARRAPAAPSPEEEADRRAILARVEAVQAIEAEYELSLGASHIPGKALMKLPTGRKPVAPAPADNGTMPKLVVSHGEVSWVRLCFLNGMLRIETSLPPDVVDRAFRANLRLNEKSVETRKGGVLEELDFRPVGEPLGRIDRETAPYSKWMLALALGIQDGDFGGGRWLAPDVIAASRWRRENGLAVLSHDNRVGQTLEFDFDPAQGYALTGYRRLHGPEKRLVVVLTCADFQPVDGLPLPLRVDTVGKDLDGEELYRYRASVKKYVVAGRDNTPDLYCIEWPKGINVTDCRNGQTVIKVQADGQRLTQPPERKAMESR